MGSVSTEKRGGGHRNAQVELMGFKCGTACLAVLLLLCRHWHVRCPLTGGRQAATEDWCKRRGSGCSATTPSGGGRQNLEGCQSGWLASHFRFQGRRRTIVRCRWRATANGALALTAVWFLAGFSKIVTWPSTRLARTLSPRPLPSSLPGAFFFSNITFRQVACGSCLGQHLN